MNSHEEEYENLRNQLGAFFGEDSNAGYPTYIEGFKGPLTHSLTGKSYLSANEHGCVALGIKIPEDEVSFEKMAAFIQKYNFPVSSHEYGVVEESKEGFYFMLNDKNKTIEVSRQGICTEQIPESITMLKDMVCDLAPKYFFEHTN